MYKWYIFNVDLITFKDNFSIIYNYISRISFSEIIAHFLNDFLQGYPPVKSPNAGR